MGNCFSTCRKRKRKRKRKSLPQHDVAVTGSPSKKDLNGDGGVDRFIEAYLDAAMVDTKEKAVERQHRRIMATLGGHLQEKDRWTGSVEKWSEESFTDDDLDNTIVTDDELENTKATELKPGARPRLKKKDSTRKPHYKDEIMLSDNIDSIVEKEIPEIPNDVNALAEDIENISSDDIPPEASKEKDFPSSNAKATCPFEEGNGKEDDNAMANEADNDFGSRPRPKQDPTRRMKNTEEEERTRTNKYIENDEESPDNSKEPSFSGSEEQSRPNVITKVKKEEETEEGDSANKPFSISSVAMPQLKTTLPQEEMDEEDMRVAKEIQKMIKDEAFNGASNDPTSSAVKVALCLQNDSKAELNNQPTLNAVIEDDKNVSTTSDCHVQSPRRSSPASDSRTRQQFKISAGENNTIEDKQLAEDIEYILNDDISIDESSKQMYSGATSPTEKVQSSASDSITTQQFKISAGENNTIEDKQLAEDIEYILNDDISIDESSKQMSSGATSPTEKVQSPKKCPASKIENMEGDNLEKDTGSTSKHEDNKGRASGKNRSCQVSPKRKVSFQLPTQEDDNLSKDGENVPTDKQTPLGTLPPPKKNSSSRKSKRDNDQLAKDIAYILNDDPDIFHASEPHEVVTASSAELTRPKTSNPKLTLAMDMATVLDLESDVPATNTCERKTNNLLDLNKELAEDIEYILSDDIVDVASERTVPSRSASVQCNSNGTVGTSNQADADKLATKDTQGTSSESLSSSNGKGHPSRKKTSTSKATYMTPLQEVAVETGSRASKVSAGPGSYLHRDFVPSSGAAYHSKTYHSTKNKDYVLKEDLHTTATISSSSSAIPRPKTRNPKLASAMKMVKNQGSSPKASRSRTVPRQSQDSLQKSRHASHTLVKDCFVQIGANGPNLLYARPAPRIKNKYASSKSKDMMVPEDVESSVEISDSSGAELQDSPREQNLQRYHTFEKQRDKEEPASMGSLKPTFRAETRSRKKNTPRLPKQRENIHLGEANKEMSEIATVDSGPSVKNPPEVQKLARRKHPKKTEEVNLKEAINEILEIPTANSGSEVHKRTGKKSSSSQSTKKDEGHLNEGRPKKTQESEEFDLDEAIKEIFGVDVRVSVANLSDSNCKQATKLNSVGKETKTSPSQKTVSVTSRGAGARRPTAQAPTVASISEVKFLDVRASSSSIDTKNCDSGCSVASGDTLRPMAAGLSMGSSAPAVKYQPSYVVRQQPTVSVSKGKRAAVPAILVKEERHLHKTRMGTSTETAVSTPGSFQSMATHRKPAVPVTFGTSHRASAGIFYKAEELELMEQIEREARSH